MTLHPNLDKNITLSSRLTTSSFGVSASLRSFFILFAILSWSPLLAQYSKDYTPRRTYDANSTELIASIRTHLQDELDRIRSRKKSEITHIYLDKTNYLIGKVRQEVFVQDDTLQLFLDGILKRIKANNILYHPPKRILVLKNSEVNAFCYLEGTFVVNVGLIARIRNESELAFAIAHELAHFELDHLRKRITKNVEMNLAKKVNREVMKVYEEDDVTLQQIDSVKKFVYDLTRHNRYEEEEADSLGFLLFKNAGYYQPAAIDLLSVLDSALFLKHPVDNLFAPLNSSNFPFKSYWLHQRPRIFSKRTTNTFIFNNDSIGSHPGVPRRKANLEERINHQERPVNYQEDAFVNIVIVIAELEAVESSLKLRQYDRCLFQSLELLNRYPGHTYLISVVSKVLIAVLEAKEAGSLAYIIPSYTSQYSAELREVNNFIHNISPEETGELAFNFLNNKSHFNPGNEDHYFLLWRICQLTLRKNVGESVERSYKAKFPNGRRFADRMK